MPSYRYGWKPDLPDGRDRLYQAAPALMAVPPKYSQRDSWPHPYDQGPLGSCVANAVNGLLAYQMVRSRALTMTQANTPSGTLSRLMTYYLARWLENAVNEDGGCQIRSGLKALTRWGACSSARRPYEPGNFRQAPGWLDYWLTLGKASGYSRLTGRAAELKAAIYADRPVVFGFSVYDSFDGIRSDGIMPMPGPSERVQGGHAVVLIGWDDQRGLWECRNSWGLAWGDAGHFWMPYTFLASGLYADDFWVLEGAA